VLKWRKKGNMGENAKLEVRQNFLRFF